MNRKIPEFTTGTVVVSVLSIWTIIVLIAIFSVPVYADVASGGAGQGVGGQATQYGSIGSNTGGAGQGTGGAANIQGTNATGNATTKDVIAAGGAGQGVGGQATQYGSIGSNTGGAGQGTGGAAKTS